MPAAIGVHATHAAPRAHCPILDLRHILRLPREIKQMQSKERDDEAHKERGRRRAGGGVEPLEED